MAVEPTVWPWYPLGLVELLLLYCVVGWYQGRVMLEQSFERSLVLRLWIQVGVVFECMVGVGDAVYVNGIELQRGN